VLSFIRLFSFFFRTVEGHGLRGVAALPEPFRF
jgi:hypothetical protein